jgi:hypothetical protein
VFGKLILGEQPEDAEVGERKGEGEESNDLKEHMVGILFSRSKLTHLQKQVSFSTVFMWILFNLSLKPKILVLRDLKS